ncbi:cupin-like domain-containing protein [Exophiala viscosa]|uniref:Cupin-like domain-containing protein n=1 Tax=Exophiala viscosa TaxID=2486360 RepID=A0AAN6IGR4_9EURO|nr:cupin-like domain-containing protein [Exophiala viscosa]
MQCLVLRTRSTRALDRINSLAHISTRLFSTSPSHLRLKQVPQLSSWYKPEFEKKAYIPALPARLPRSATQIAPASSKWFIHDANHRLNIINDKDHTILTPRSSELRTSFWSQHESITVPLELTSTTPDRGESFNRVEDAPLKLLLTYLSSNSPSTPQHSIYLAQCDLSSLPRSITDDIPTPSLLQPSSAIKGDIYASSLWLGRPPTYTPLHRDPNPNLFMQLAGRKLLRLLPPEIGNAVFEDVQNHLDHNHASANIRGDEMMAGPEKLALHEAIWTDDPSVNRYADVLATYSLETEVELGDALFIPKGWWHSVKGVGEGITASVNWWFR